MAKRKKDEGNYDPDGLAYELEVARGTTSGRLTQRKAAERIWKAVASGKACENTLLSWCKYLAEQVTKNILDDKAFDDRLRGTRALQCIGLYDRDDEYLELQTYIEMCLDFEHLATISGGLQRKLTPMEIVRHWRSFGHFENVSDRNAAKTVKRQWSKVTSK